LRNRVIIEYPKTAAGSIRRDLQDCRTGGTIMAEAKTKATKQSVATFLKAVTDGQKREDAKHVIELMRAATKEEPVMWGTSIIGFGTYSYK
jgi:hypothetical protein